MWSNALSEAEHPNLLREIAELLEQITDRYHDLLDAVQQSDTEGYP